MLELSTTATFDRLFSKLPKSVQRKAATKTDLFRENPFHLSLLSNGNVAYPSINSRTSTRPVPDACVTLSRRAAGPIRTGVLDTILHPERILAGKGGELIAVRQIEQGKHLAVVYREHKEDGFVITAFITSKGRSLERRKKLWP